MGQSTRKDESRQKAGGLRRSVLMLLAFVYLFVGVAHQISCFDQGVATVSSVQNASDEPGDTSLADFAICDHCPTCSPALMPVPLTEAAPCGLPSSNFFSVASFFAGDHAWFDSPPPKSLT